MNARAVRRVLLLLWLPAVAVLLTAPAVGGQVGRDVAAESNVEYASPGGEPLVLDVYLPGGDGPHPAVIALHGGQWTTGDKSNASGAAAFLAQAGFAVFTPNYRHAPDHPYPAQLEDVTAAVRWVRAHAGEYGVDPERVAIFGASAGGHLAALLAVTAKDPETSVTAAASWSGPMDLAALAAEGGPKEMIVGQFLGCQPGQGACERAAEEASPISHVDGRDPPLFLANGTDETIPVEQATVMAEALERADVPHELMTVQGPMHGFMYGREAMRPTIAFLEGHIGSGSASGAPSLGGERPGAGEGAGAEERPGTAAGPRREPVDAGYPAWVVSALALTAIVVALGAVVVARTSVGGALLDRLRGHQGRHRH